MSYLMEPDTHLAAQKMVVVFLVKKDGMTVVLEKSVTCFPAALVRTGATAAVT